MTNVGGYKNGWHWIFILEGILTIIVAFAAYFFIVNYPDTAKFLSNDERDFIQTRLKADSDATQNEGFSWVNVKAALVDPKCWLYGLAFHTMSLPLYTLSLFLVSLLTLNKLHLILISTIAKYHCQSGLHCCVCPTSHCPTICARHSVYHSVGLAI
jgi:hypothetical protein